MVMDRYVVFNQDHTKVYISIYLMI